MKQIWSEELRVHSYEVDFQRRATLEALCRYFLEAAWNHAEELGVGYTHLVEQGRFWVLARWLIAIEERPRWGERVALSTWPRPVKGVFALRDFEITRPSGQRLAAGTSSWLVLDAATKRPQRLEKFLASIPALLDRQALARDAEKVPSIASVDASAPMTARYSDIDVNRHVNSARYVGWLMDTYSTEFHAAHSPGLLEINYVGETLHGEGVTVATQQIRPGEFHHSIRKSGASEVVRARLVWATP